MEDLRNRLLQTLDNYWHTPYALALLIIGTALIALAYFGNIALENVSPWTWILIGLLVAAAAVLWYATNRVPRVKRGKIGVVVALLAETEDQGKQIYNDLVASLRRSLDDPREFLRFHFIELPYHHARRIVDDESAARYARKCHAHYLLFGDARIRKINGKDVHALRLRQLVAHRLVPKSWSQNLTREMQQIFPERIAVSRDNELLELEITSQWLSEAARYFMATAAMFSGDVDTAQSLLERLHHSKHLAAPPLRSIPGVAALRILVPRRLAEVYTAQSRFAHLRWRETRNDSDLDQTVQYLERWNAVSPNEYRYHLGKAIWHFARHRDLASALSEINKCRGSSDATWRYSAAFLESYRGDLTTASRIYEKAFTRPVDQLVPFEVEEFIQWVLQIEPDKVQLYYCLGLINLKMKHDLELALTDFRRFLEASEGMANFARARSEASQYIEQIEARLGHD